MPASKTERQQQPSKLWPWSARHALLVVPLLLGLLLTAYGLVRRFVGWPIDHYQGWTLFAIVLLAVLPVVLLLLEVVVSSGGTLAGPGGLKLSFEATTVQAAATVTTVSLADNLDSIDSDPVGKSGMRNILR